jgi:hypothetical protein
MIFGDEDKKLCASLVDIMNDISGLLKAAGEELSRYKGIQKIKNIAKSHDPSGLKNIHKYLDGISNVISDNKAFSSVLGRKLDQAYQLSNQINRANQINRVSEEVDQDTQI